MPLPNSLRLRIVRSFAGLLILLSVIFRPAEAFDPTRSSHPSNALTVVHPGGAAVAADVGIDDAQFSPASLDISIGDTVTWTNNGTVFHTVTSDDGVSFSSGALSGGGGGTFTHTFDSAGTFAYHCSDHPAMTGSIAVTTPAVPVILGPFSASGAVGLPFSYQITATGTPTGYGVDILPDGLVMDTSTGLISGTPTTVGTTESLLSATNGNGTGSSTVAFTIDLSMVPAITSPLTARGAVGQPFRYQITATGSPTGFGVDVLPVGLVIDTSTGLISGTPTTVGTMDALVSANNGTGTGSSTVAFTIDAGSVPAITSALTALGAVGQAFNYQITATGTPTGYGVDVLPAGLAIDPATGLISGTPTTIGTTESLLSATNGTGTGSSTVAFTIDPGMMPIITSPSAAIGAVSQAFNYQITATGTPTGYGVDVLPAGLVLDGLTGVISGTPTAADTTNTLLSATNGSGTGSTTIAFTIDPSSSGGSAPAITSALTAGGTVGQAFNYQITASNTPTSFGALGLPAGLVVNGTTGMISGTPTAVGAASSTVTASNGSGTGSSNLLFTVTDSGGGGGGVTITDSDDDNGCGTGTGLAVVLLGSLACHRRRRSATAQLPR